MWTTVPHASICNVPQDAQRCRPAMQTRLIGEATARKSTSVYSSSKSKKKRAQQLSKTTNDSSNDAVVPRPVDPPPASGQWSKPSLALSSSIPPPGFTTTPPLIQPCGYSDAYVRLLRHRAFFAYRFFVGKAVELHVVGSMDRYTGILDCIDLDECVIVLKRTKRICSSNEALPFEEGRSLLFQHSQVAHIIAQGGVEYTDRISPLSTKTHGFCTDSEISNPTHKELYGRELKTAREWLDAAFDTSALEDSNDRRGSSTWNQFEANEKLFGVVSTFEEELYTTKLDKSKLSLTQVRIAEKLALEMESQCARGNVHLQEERGQMDTNEGMAWDEEMRYSSVDRGWNEKRLVSQKAEDFKNGMEGVEKERELDRVLEKEWQSTMGIPKLSFSEAVQGRSSSGAKKKEEIQRNDEKVATSATVERKEKVTPTVENELKENEIQKKSKSFLLNEEATLGGLNKTLNPKAKEFKLNASAAAFTPSFAVSDVTKAHGLLPYRDESPGYMPFGRGYVPSLQEEWTYDGINSEDDMNNMPLYGYGVPPMGPNGVPLMFSSMVPQPSGLGGTYGYHQQGYHGQSYYSPGYLPYASGSLQPPLPPSARGDEVCDNGSGNDETISIK